MLASGNSSNLLHGLSSRSGIAHTEKHGLCRKAETEAIGRGPTSLYVHFWTSARQGSCLDFPRAMNLYKPKDGKKPGLALVAGCRKLTTCKAPPVNKIETNEVVSYSMGKTWKGQRISAALGIRFSIQFHATSIISCCFVAKRMFVSIAWNCMRHCPWDLLDSAWIHSGISMRLSWGTYRAPHVSLYQAQPWWAASCPAHMCRS